MKPEGRTGQGVPSVGLGRFELPTSRLSGVRSNQLSYRPRTYDATLERRTEPDKLVRLLNRFNRSAAAFRLARGCVAQRTPAVVRRASVH